VLREIDFQLKICADGSQPVAFVGTGHLNTNMCKFELSQKESKPIRLIPQTWSN